MLHRDVVLTPAQQQAADGLLGGLPAGDVFVLHAKPGMGKTTVLRYLQGQAGGTLLGIRQFLEELMARGPEAIEESFLRVLDDALAKFDLVFVDDLHLITNVVENCDYQRTYLLDAALTAVLGEAAAQRKKLVFGTAEDSPWPIRRRAYSFEIGDFTPDDYAAVCRPYFQPGPAVDLDAARVHRFAPLLNAYQLRNACAWLARECSADTDRLIEYLQSHNMTSNVELEEVAPVSWHDLKGVDDVIHALEAKVALPFENDELAARLGLKPKRGVLLAGPPGTGKTTIGRALAHRLKSKFFLIDGTVIAGSHDFYSRVRQIFDAARRNAPAVVFIDDADVIFEGREDRGLYRYLLTILDGLESASAGRVCVMMTAMNVSSLPQALVRSGRVELWLETRLPGVAARVSILEAKFAGLPPEVASANIGKLAAASRGLTPADLNTVVEDGKLLLAHDLSTATPLRPVEDYFLEAIETVRANQVSYAGRKPLGFSANLSICPTARNHASV